MKTLAVGPHAGVRSRERCEEVEVASEGDRFFVRLWRRSNGGPTQMVKLLAETSTRDAADAVGRLYWY